ncbi:FAD-dependent oxidoreductase (plasmid) [Halococcus dombrowskii]|uniref:FAD-dependent oxidoreductase n=1 Tax=Halococcus dombrowskii TaxID=179637 RepID=A0AAV3SLZ6_HALDO|nr:FAD-dependent oxidoreductase [Halococcus dombrowskii]UOO96790.1 FAD-dependent oxidoreductase [Halococcus dombrowskii]
MNDALFQSTELGPVQLPNRIMSSGHQTTLVRDHLPTDDFSAYHLARAKGGAGLVVLEAHAVHESGLLNDHTIDASTDAIVDAHKPFTEAMHNADTRVMVQLFHGGRERYAGEYAPPALSASDKPTDRLHVIPRPLETAEVYEMIDAFADAATRMEQAGLDGVEVVGSHTYLPAQFWSPNVNERDDEFGGSLEDRCRFTTEIVERIRKRTSDEFAVGIRLSAEERSEEGLSFDETLPIIEHIDDSTSPDYWSVVVGSSSTQEGCSYIVPPATESEAVTRSPAAVIDQATTGSTIVTSRINTPEKATQMLAETGADVVGMTRALIADPELPRKTKDDNWNDVIPCVACNQGCIGRYQEELPIRCTINPITGREAEYSDHNPVMDPKSILVVGGGPAGLVAATTAAERDHDVTLLEAAGELGGQVTSYADLDHRGRYQDWLETLNARLNKFDVTVELNMPFAPDDVDEYNPDELILATGAKGRVPEIPISDELATYTAAEALLADEPFGEAVLVSDWDGNEAALDVAIQATKAGAEVEVVTSAYTPGESVQQYIQNSLLGELYAADVTMTPHHQIDAVETEEIILQNIFNDERTRRTGVDTVVFAHGGETNYDMYRTLMDSDVSVHRIGDSWAPRTLDEAVWEAFKTATEL